MLMELAFDDATRVQKLIMKVSHRLVSLRSAAEKCCLHFASQSEWLRDAFLELDPSSEKVAFVFSSPDQQRTGLPYNRYAGSRKRRGNTAGEGDEEEGEYRSIFRLEAVGTLGSTEVSRRVFFPR